MGIIKSLKNLEHSNIWIIICQNPKFQVVSIDQLNFTAISKFRVLSGLKNLQNLQNWHYKIKKIIVFILKSIFFGELKYLDNYLSES